MYKSQLIMYSKTPWQIGASSMEIGTIRPVDIENEMRVAYLDYAMSVIVSRALT